MRVADRRILTLATLCLAVLIAQVDTSVVNLAVRSIGSYFSASVATLQWVVDSYNLVYAALLLTGGLLADLYGRRRIFLVGVAVFTAASLLCAFAPTVWLLVSGRALAGLGAALLLPASLAIIRVVWPDRAARGRVLGIWAACNGVALAIGPTLGGLLIPQFGWRSVFLVVVPLGLAAFVLAVPAIPESSDPEDRHFDMSGQILGAAVLGGLVFASIEARGATLTALAALGIAVSALPLFLMVESKRGAMALVPLDMFRVREFAGAMTATMGMTFGMYGVLFLLPLTWQSVDGFDPLRAGMALMPMALVYVFVSPFSGALTRRHGTRLMITGGLFVIALGLLILGVTADGGSIIMAEIALALTGLGMGLATGPFLAVALNAVPAARSGTAAALINVARMTGATIGVAVLGAVFSSAQHRLIGLRYSMLLGSLVQFTCALIALATTGTGPAPVRDEASPSPDAFTPAKSNRSGRQ
ncbi:MAG: MFS transporter [Acidiferrobacteraceae bacterium]